MCSDVVAAAAQLAAKRLHGAGCTAHMFETAPLAGMPTVRPSETNPSGDLAVLGRAPRCSLPRELVVRVEGGEDARLVTLVSSCRARASMWRVTPPG